MQSRTSSGSVRKKALDVGGQSPPERLTASLEGASLPRMTTDMDSLRDRFEEAYGRDAAGAARAPGRVNLIGEHTDYNDGFVLPIAIERETVALWAPRKDRTVNFASLEAHPACQANLDSPIVPGEPKWANYCKGVAALLNWIISKLVEGQRAGMYKMSCDFRSPEEKSSCLQS